jgi:hypothetical protein
MQKIEGEHRGIYFRTDADDAEALMMLTNAGAPVEVLASVIMGCLRYERDPAYRYDLWMLCNKISEQCLECCHSEIIPPKSYWLTENTVVNEDTRAHQKCLCNRQLFEVLDDCDTFEPFSFEQKDELHEREMCYGLKVDWKAFYDRTLGICHRCMHGRFAPTHDVDCVFAECYKKTGECQHFFGK